MESSLPEVTGLVGAEPVGFPCASFVTSLAGLWAPVQSPHVGGSQPGAPGLPFCISFPRQLGPVVLITIYMPVGLHVRPLALNSELQPICPAAFLAGL